MEEESTRQSRLFVILAIALIGLLVLGLLGIGGVFVIRQNLQQQAAMARPTPTLLIRLPDPSPTFTPVKPNATNTPAPTPTNTPVLNGGSSTSGEEAAVGSKSTNQQNGVNLPLPSKTPVAGASTAGASENPETVPETGLGGFEIVLIALGLVIVLFVARRMRTAA